MKTIKFMLCAAAAALYGVCRADSVQLVLENDCFIDHQDNDYTHGTELRYYAEQSAMYFSVQQNMYTPSNLRKKEHISGDRPYAGWLGAEIGRELFRDPESGFTHYLGFDFGMVGEHSYAGQTQRFIHKVLDCRYPAGWENQLADEFCVNAQWWTKYNWFLNDYVAVVPRVGIMAGTLKDAVEAGFDLKIGYNLKKDVGNGMMFSAPRKTGFWKDFSCYAYCGPDGRYYMYDHMLDGSMFNSHDDDLSVTKKEFVGEIQFGVGFEFRSFYFRYYAAIRSREFKGQKQRPDYGGLVFGFGF